MKTTLLASLLFLFSSHVFATSIQKIIILPQTNPARSLIADEKIRELVAQFIPVDRFRMVRAQLIEQSSQSPAHIIVHLHTPGLHQLTFASITLDAHFHAVDFQNQYELTADDEAHQPGLIQKATCPDPSVQFIGFAPNQDDFEIQITKNVTATARQKGYKTVELLVTDATRQNYFNYLSCPQVKGNFYDGDSNPSAIVTADGVITAKELALFRYQHHVTQIWLACQAFNDPLLTTMIKTSESQKYAAGVTDLIVGPSDNAAQCTMIAALNGQPMTAAFQACYKQYDTAEDVWGFAGNGADIFGQ